MAIYNLDELIPYAGKSDTFTIGGTLYQLGPVSEKVRSMVLERKHDGDILEFWRPAIARLLSDSNDHTPELTDDVVAAIIPILSKMIHEGY